MNYEVCGTKIVVLCEEFNPKSILECGQVFSYKLINGFYFVFPQDKLAVVYKENNRYIIEILNGNIEFFVNFFDLNVNYAEIIKKIQKINTENDELILNAINFGKGIRILNQNKIETLISFIFSQNNNIKRFTNSLELLRKQKGKEISYRKSSVREINEILRENKFFSFPTTQTLETLDKEFFASIGAGYRAEYLALAVGELNKFERKENLSTVLLQKELLALKGVGVKVAECVMLFGFHKTDVFPVDTWINKVYFNLIKKEEKINPIKISQILSEKFGDLSGFVQQYLFYYKREKNI